MLCKELPNGERPAPAYFAGVPAGGWDDKRRFDGTNSKPRKLAENAQTPTSRVHSPGALPGRCFSLPRNTGILQKGLMPQ